MMNEKKVMKRTSRLFDQNKLPGNSARSRVFGGQEPAGINARWEGGNIEDE